MTGEGDTPATLVEWLTKILDEDEKAAERSAGSISAMQNDDYGRLLAPKSWVLADVEAKRAIIENHTALPVQEPWCEVDEESWPCGTLRMLASAYAARPGYREEWRP